MAKYKPDELIVLHNNIAKRKNLPTIVLGTKMSISDLCDKIEWVNAYKAPTPRKRGTRKQEIHRFMKGVSIKYDKHTLLKFSRT